MILQQNNTHKAIKNGNKINIVLKGIKIDDLDIKDEVLYSIPLENKDDLFAIFENLDETNRTLLAEANSAFSNY